MPGSLTLFPDVLQLANTCHEEILKICERSLGLAYVAWRCSRAVLAPGGSLQNIQ